MMNDLTAETITATLHGTLEDGSVALSDGRGLQLWAFNVRRLDALLKALEGVLGRAPLTRLQRNAAAAIAETEEADNGAMVNRAAVVRARAARRAAVREGGDE